MKIRFILSVFFVIAATLLIIAVPASAQVSVGGDDVVSTETTAAVTVGSDDAPVSADTASVTVGGDDAGPVAPASESADLVGTISIGNDDADATAPTVESPDLVGSVVNGGDDVAVETPSTPTNTSTGGSVGGGSRGSRIINPTSGSSVVVTAVKITPASCPLITSKILKIGGTNDSADVSRLQSFLKEVEKLDVDVNGTFDAKTESAVKAFQLKYQSEILAPWKATRASGIVYITTSKKINEISCNQPMVLDASELSIIEAYNPTNATSTTNSVEEGSVQQPNSNVTNPNTDSGDVIIGVGSSTENVASVSNAPVLKRFWNFLTGLFR